MNLRTIGQRLWHWRPELGVEWITLLVCIYMAAVLNDSFWHAAMAGKPFNAPGTWRFFIGTFVAMTALHFSLLVCIANRWIVKPLLSALLIATAMAAYYMDRYAVFMDTNMLGNILHTEYKEARELVTAGFVWHVLLLSIPPIALLLKLRIVRQPWKRAALIRALSLFGSIGLAACGMLFAFRDLSALMRNQKEVRYLVTPGNYLYAAIRVLHTDVNQARRERIPVGADARVGVRPASAKPRLLVVIVGETVRAQNWGLNGYVRDTTPQLRALNVVNFSKVESCGTATEVSLPCMFSAVGRRDYDEDRIRDQQSLLHVLQYAGIRTLWRDNQTGCKGVCEGLPFQQWNDAQIDGLCKDGLCFDEILLHDLQADIDAVSGDLVVVLHPLGNHGPSYFARYPERFRKFTPTCDSAELGTCSNEQIVNSYDNAVLYADHFVSETIRLLERQSARDSALIYVSDHGESLGEHGLFLHGIPYSIAPEQQTAVPMVAWLNPGFAGSVKVDLECVRRASANRAAHDNLFHSVLGLLDVSTKVYEPTLDLFRSCRAANRE
jgi:lipid A ethanolaminephosphotransferase